MYPRHKITGRKLPAVERILAAWRSRPPKQVEPANFVRTIRQIDSARLLIKGLKDVDWVSFDPFVRCGVVPLERHTRDFLAGLLEREPLALRIMLNECATANRLAGHFKKVRVTSYEVKREVKMGDVRPDVVAIAENFLVAIEIKRRIGFETTVRGKKQCVRLNRAAKKYARKNGIDPKNVLPIFLTPQQTRASDPLVTSISSVRLFTRIGESKPSFASFIDFLRRD
jgi:hypothetical protein